MDFKSAKDDNEKTNTTESTETAETISDNQEDIAEKVEGIDNAFHDRRPNAGGGGCINDEHNISKENRTNSEDLVRELESRLGTRNKSPKRRKVLLLTGSLNLGRGIGMTVKELEKRGFGKDHAEKMLRDLRDSGFLSELDKRVGHMKQYALPNCMHLVEAKTNGKEKEEILPNDFTLLIANRLSLMEDGYHNIHMETFLNYREDYDLLGWPVSSTLNKQKVKTFKLDMKRSVTFTIAPNGAVNIAIGCTHKPYKFHSAAGLIDFFVACGQIFNLLQMATINRFNVVPRVGDWHLTQFDYNKDIPIKDLQDKYSTNVISWSSKGVLKLDYLGTIFQVYCKFMPFVGECLRFEGHYNAKSKVKLEDMVADIANGNKHPFTTLEEMILNGRSKIADDRS